MAFALALKYLLIVLAVVLAVGVVWWARRYPNRSREHPDRLRMPRVFLLVGALLMAVGLLMGLASLTLPDTGYLLSMRIAAGAALLAGALVLLAYRNRYVAIRVDEVAFRTILGRERLIPYRDISSYRMRMRGGRPTVSVRSTSGARLRLNIRLYDATPLLMAIDFKEKAGRWPRPGEAVGVA